MNPYEVLGVPKDATADEIKKAYRKLAAKHHPDRGGDKEEFQRIQEAYSVLKDAELRHRYDESGVMPDAQRERYRERLQRNAVGAFMSALRGDNLDPIETAKYTIKNELKQADHDIRDIVKQIERMKKARERVVHKGDGPNLFADAITKEIEALDDGILKIKEDIAFGNDLMNLMNEYQMAAGEQDGASRIDIERVLFGPNGDPYSAHNLDW